MKEFLKQPAEGKDGKMPKSETTTNGRLVGAKAIEAEQMLGSDNAEIFTEVEKAADEQGVVADSSHIEVPPRKLD